MKISSLLLFLFMPFPLLAAEPSACEKFLPSWNLSQYLELVGRDPETGRGYTGSVQTSRGKETYLLTREIAGVKTNGEAWMEQCGPEIRVLVGRYYTRPITEFSCATGADSNNALRVTCITAQRGKWTGLEAWFDSPWPAP